MASTGGFYYELYAQNQNSNMYYRESNDTVDIDGDDNRTETIGYNSFYYSVIAPSSFVTSETISDYNDTEDITIAPNVAEISNATTTASSSTVSSISIICSLI